MFGISFFELLIILGILGGAAVGLIVLIIVLTKKPSVEPPEQKRID